MSRPAPPSCRNITTPCSRSLAELNQEATAAFTEGTEAREISEKYVRGTVLLATVLFLIALAQRFKIRKVRVGLLLVATALMIYALANVAMYPRL